MRLPTIANNIWSSGRTPLLRWGVDKPRAEGWTPKLSFREVIPLLLGICVKIGMHSGAIANNEPTPRPSHFLTPASVPFFAILSRSTSPFFFCTASLSRMVRREPRKPFRKINFSRIEMVLILPENVRISAGDKRCYRQSARAACIPSPEP